MKFFKNTQERLKRASNANLLMEQVGFIRRLFGGLFRQERSDRKDTFEGLGALGVTPEHITEAKVAFKRWLSVFLVIAGLVLVYTIYTLCLGRFYTAALSALVFIACLAQAFRYHFWLVQIEKQKLGCTFQEWLDYTLRSLKVRSE